MDRTVWFGTSQWAVTLCGWEGNRGSDHALQTSLVWPPTGSMTTPKLPLPLGLSGPHVIHGSLGPPKSTLQLASWSVQLFFFQCSATRPRDRQTYRPRYSICSNRPHLASLLLRCGLKPEAKKSAAGSVQGERWIIWKIKFQTMTYELTVNIIYVKFVAVFVRVTWAWNPPYMILNHTQ